MAERKLKCEKCGREFVCKTHTGECWCKKYKLNKENLDFLKANYKDCLCEYCIKEIYENQNNQND